jgi:hypothetical protein
VALATGEERLKWIFANRRQLDCGMLPDRQSDCADVELVRDDA